MKIHRNRPLLLLVTAFILFSAFRADKPFITIFTIGDSTMANKKLDGGNPERGWGMMLPGFFSEDIRVDNHAANGRSSKSFITEGRWEKVISQVAIKLRKGKSPEQIADELEESLPVIEKAILELQQGQITANA